MPWVVLRREITESKYNSQLLRQHRLQESDTFRYHRNKMQNLKEFWQLIVPSKSVTGKKVFKR